MKLDISISSKITAILPYLCFALIVFSVKLIIIANYGNATPFWDQWDAEADGLYRPLLEGNLTWADLLAPHNEHRIFTTRLLAIALLYLNGGVLNPILQMQVSAGIHVLALTLLLFYTAKALTPAFRNTMLVLCTIVFSIPFGWENILAGFQVQFYFLLLFSFIFLWTMAMYKTYSTKWWLGFAAGLFSPLSLASGAFTLIAGCFILSIRRLLIEHKHEVAISSIVLLFILSGIFIILTPVIPLHDRLKAHSTLQFFNALLAILSWPAHSIVLGVLVIQIPVLFLIYHVLYKQEYRTKPLLFLIAIVFWLFGQIAAIAYGRGAISPLSSRYLDLFAVVLVANFAAISILFDHAHLRQKLFLAGLWGLWMAIILLKFDIMTDELNQTLKNKLITSLEEENNVRAYLCTGDFLYLQNKSIPYPDPVRLRSLLDNPTIRSFLPGNIYGPNSNNSSIFCNQYALAKPLNGQKTSEATTCTGSIDYINGNLFPKQFSTSYKLEVVGWLAPSPTQGLSTINSPIVVLTDSTGKNMFFSAQTLDRSDVASAYKNADWNTTGFKSTINISTIAGDYKLGLGFTEGNEVIKLCPQFKIPGIITK